MQKKTWITIDLFMHCASMRMARMQVSVQGRCVELQKKAFVMQCNGTMTGCDQGGPLTPSRDAAMDDHTSLTTHSTRRAPAHEDMLINCPSPYVLPCSSPHGDMAKRAHAQ